MTADQRDRHWPLALLACLFGAHLAAAFPLVLSTDCSLDLHDRLHFHHTLLGQAEGSRLGAFTTGEPGKETVAPVREEGARS